MSPADQALVRLVDDPAELWPILAAAGHVPADV
jgi:hypothetical protein